MPERIRNSPAIALPRQRVQLLAAGEQQNHGDRGADRDPVRQSERHRAEEIGVDVEQGNDQSDIRLAGLVGLTDMPAVEDRQPGAEHQKAGGERDEMHRIEQVEHAAGERQHRKRADAARAPGVGAGEEILEGEAEKQAQRHKQRDARH